MGSPEKFYPSFVGNAREKKKKSGISRQNNIFECHWLILLILLNETNTYLQMQTLTPKDIPNQMHTKAMLAITETSDFRPSTEEKGKIILLLYI